MSTPESNEEDRPVCSVLNTVVDHVMVPPTSLEKQELEQDIHVPVLRIFGPIIRRDCDNNHSPKQSACLYIHGAFPYLLCRPRVAGADGSLSRSTPQNNHINWDSVPDVERVLPIIQETLEKAMQESVGSAEKKSTLIRRLSVVSGRGFYTFCPGPPAPFVRVEYYDPKMRWRVKMLLERGLELPHVYHPDPNQYDGSEEVQHDPASDAEPLRFHCYEAHIPYTMQVFKDYNLAGLRYVHVNDVLFRTPLPSKIRPSYTIPRRSGTLSTGDHLFLSGNTPEELCWPVQSEEAPPSQMSSEDNHLGIVELQQASPDDAAPDSDQEFEADVAGQSHSSWILSPPSSVSKALHPPLRKETTCDLELDVHVRGILNVRSVLTELSSTQARETVHWRAVPSLQEIWIQERQRMAKLVSPRDDFLSPAREEATPPFTLNVKKGAALPGTRLAVRGMERLRRVTQGLDEEYQRASKQIIERYEVTISNADNTLCVKDVFTPDEDETASALEMLGSLFGEEISDELSMMKYKEPHNSRFRDSVSQYYEPDKREPIGEAHIEALSQLVDRGEPIVAGPFNHPEDFIDPETLAPFALLDEEEEDEKKSGCSHHDKADSEADFERELDFLSSQALGTSSEEAIDSSIYSSSPIDFDTSLADTDLRSDATAESDFSSSSSIDGQKSDSASVFDTGEDSKASSSIVLLSESWRPESNVFVEPVLIPPRRGELKVSTALGLKRMNHGRSPSWLTFSHKFDRNFSFFEGHTGTLVSEMLSSSCVEQTRQAPCRGTVVEWAMKSVRKERKRKFDDFEGNTEHSLIDKSQKFLVSDNPRSAEHVEEVQWNPSQPILSLTQTTVAPVEGCMIEESSKQTNQSLVSGETMSGSPPVEDEAAGAALVGMGDQGGRVWVEAKGSLKAKIKPSVSQHLQNGRGSLLPTPVSVMSIEIHVQCRLGRAGSSDSKQIAMQPDPERDAVSAITYVYGRDPGGGEPLEILERGCLFVPAERELSSVCTKAEGRTELLRALEHGTEKAMPSQSMGKCSPLYVGCIGDEKQLLLRIASVVYAKDPDVLVSWDTQGAGIGYLVERGKNIVEAEKGGPGIEMARLLGRVRTSSAVTEKVGEFHASEDTNKFNKSTATAKKNAESTKWSGSGLGSDWDDRVGAGAAAASIIGRLVFAGWKLVAEEVKHPNVSYLPAAVATVLDQRIPYHDDLRLTEWYSQIGGRERWRVLNYRLSQATAGLLLLDALDIIGRAGEAARLSGVEFSQSFPGIRGSQYKVEGVLLRALQSLNSEERGSSKGRKINANHLSNVSKSLSHSQSPWKVRRGANSHETGSVEDGVTPRPVHQLSERNYFFFSPSLTDTTAQEALEVQALTLEPQSGHHEDPVVVCDFTALYPSLVIAYNLCYSTCAGRLEYHSTRGEMRREGRTTGKVGPVAYSERRTATVLRDHLKSSTNADKENDRVYAAPTGTIYVGESVVKGVLPQVLDELLSTRAMLKKASKLYKKKVTSLSASILRQLEARQLALKYVANVTYGYTSATFSGRCAMPLLADSIVECGRRTLHLAIDMVNSWGKDPKGKWHGCEVIYGDTDSLFIKLPGRSVHEAFTFGEEVCQAVTASNPPPVQLKLEKVYHGSIMQTKKKYVGMKYESRDQVRPVFEAKGIETVRRDQAPITQKILRNSLITLFRSGLDAVRKYLERQWTLILTGKLPVSDFILTGRVRSRYRGGSVGPVQAVLARRLAEADPGRTVKNKERLAYVIVATPGVTFRLKDCVLTPMELLEQWDAYTIHNAYYITKHVNAALQRCLGLSPHRINVNKWYEECAKPKNRIHFWPLTKAGSSMMISSYFGSDSCSICGRKCKASGRTRVAVCVNCRSSDTPVVSRAFLQLARVEEDGNRVAQICSDCNGCFEDTATFGTTSTGPLVILDTSRNRKSTIITPLANCTCIDCPHTYERHRHREAQIEATAICRALDAL